MFFKIIDQKRSSLLIILLLFTIAGIVVFTSRSKAPKPPLSLEGSTMGTYWRVQYYKKNNTPPQDQLKNAIEKKLTTINKQMSTYDPTSELSLFNAQKESRTQSISPELAYVIDASLSLSQYSNGAFDISVAPLINLWGFGEHHSLTAPSSEALSRVKNQIGYQHIIRADSKLGKQTAELSINVSAIAKGYAVDEIALELDNSHIDNYLVDIGGELKAKGKRKERPWKIAIEKPVAFKPGNFQRVPMQTLVLNDISVATSGDYRNFYWHEGRRVSHTIDPSTGYPVTHDMASVTVLHASAMWADGWATTLMVLGEEKGLALANQHGIPVYMIIREGSDSKDSELTFRVVSNQLFDDMQLSIND